MIKRNLLVMGLAVLLSACGFQLRGTGTTELAIKELDVTARNSYGETVQQLRQVLENSGVKVYSGAAYKLNLLDEKEEQRNLSYASAGRASDIELSTTLFFEIQGHDHLPLMGDKIQIQKVVSHDGNNLVGSDSETIQVRKEMRRELVQRMVLRLQLITPEQLDKLQQTADAKAKADADALKAAQERGAPGAPFALPMKLAPAQLAKHLQGSLAPVYIVSGDDPLLCQEAADAIRTAARQQGFDERQVFSADASFDWGTLLQAGASMSLFAEKRLLELRLPSGKPGDKGAAALMEYCARPAEDTLLLISLPKLDGSAQKTKWGKALVEGGQTQFIQIWPVDSSQLPQWIRQRLSQSGLSASQDAVELIAARVEGNLLAAAQEIEKLKLMAEGGQITVETVQGAVADSARFDVFGLVDAILNGEPAHALRMLEGLRGEGVEPPVILWALARELRLLANIALQYSQGIPLDKAFSQARPPVWDKRKPLISKALQRHSAQRWAQLLLEAQRIDAQIKGQAAGSPWMSLSLLRIAGLDRIQTSADDSHRIINLPESTHMSKKPSKHGPNKAKSIIAQPLFRSRQERAGKGKGSYRREAFQSNSWEASYFLAA
eukprot:gene1302-1495_t